MHSLRSTLFAVVGFIFLLVATPAYMYSLPDAEALQGNSGLALNNYYWVLGNGLLNSSVMFPNSPPVTADDFYTVHRASLWAGRATCRMITIQTKPTSTG